MTEFLESLKEMGHQKESIFNETYDYETSRAGNTGRNNM